jgi:hypothetical protein
MVLWTIEKEKSTGPVNEASLLQRFVEANLNKTDPADIERSSLDFVIKESVLSHLAYRFKLDDIEQIDKNDFLQFAMDFFKARSWHHDAADFIEDLIRKGVLVQFSDEEGTYVSFHFRCLQEYFGARYLQENRQALDQLFARDEFVDSVREVDILTGLTRNSPDLIVKLVESLLQQESKHSFRADERIRDFNNFHFQLFKADAASVALASEIQEASATDEEIHALLDLSEETPDRKEPSKVKANESFVLKYFLTTLLLSKVVRNNELLDNEKLKLEAVNRAVECWCFFAAEGSIVFDRLMNGEGTPEALERFSNLSTTEKPFMEFVLKCFMNVIIGAIAYDSLGTEKLYVIFRKAYDATPEDKILKRLILLYVLMYVGFSMSVVPKDVMGRAKTFIKETINPSLALLLTTTLYTMYLNPFLGEDNRKKIEELMLEIGVKVQPGPAANKKRESLKGGLVSQLRSLRGTVDIDSIDEEE